jgi:predicted acyltransferase
MVKQDHISSVDAFRGITIAFMMLAANPGSWNSVYPQLKPAPWNGWTLTDFIFPFFLWVMGVTMTMTWARRFEWGDSHNEIFIQATRRAGELILIGIILTTFPFGLLGSHFSFSTMRIPGILQRTGICYFFVTLIYFSSTIRGQILWVIGLLALYWLMLEYFPVPGYGAGNLTAMGSIERYIDSMVIGGHTLPDAPAPGFDPDGIISTLGALSTTLIGIVFGHYLCFRNHSKGEKVCGMIFAGGILLIVGVVLEIWMPINENLWTPTFTLFTAGAAACIFAFFYFIVDMKGYKKWATPFIISGMNAFFFFTLSVLAGRLLGLVKFNVKLSTGTYGMVDLQNLAMDNVFGRMFTSLNASLAWSILWVLFLFLATWLIRSRKKWLIKA